MRPIRSHVAVQRPRDLLNANKPEILRGKLPYLGADVRVCAVGDILVGNSISRVTQEINVICKEIVSFQRLISGVSGSCSQGQTYSFIVFQPFPGSDACFSVLRRETPT